MLPHSGGDYLTQLHHQDKETSGCKSLLAAILFRALEDLKSPTVKLQHKRQARRWIMSNESKAEHFTFLYCCEVLGLQVATLRDSLGILDQRHGGRLRGIQLGLLASSKPSLRHVGYEE